MGERLLSVGLDIGTTSTQMILSELTVENRASAFSVPEMQISRRQILYRSPIHFTPLLRDNLVDGAGIRAIVTQEYHNAGITRQQVDTGAVIITGETSRKENAATVLQSLSDFAGDFVVATAGPDLESLLAAKGAGAVEFSADTGKTVIHMDIGGGTSNLACIVDGTVTATGCWNVGGRLLKFDPSGVITYRSPVLDGIFPCSVGQTPSAAQRDTLADTLAAALEMAAGLRPWDPTLAQLQTAEASPWPTPPAGAVISFSGGVADCIHADHPDLAFGDIGPALGRAIRRSRLCRGEYRLGTETIRATVIGAGSHATQLSGSTVFHQHVTFPMKNLPVVTGISALSRLDTPGILFLTDPPAHYAEITRLADQFAATWPAQPVLIAMEADMAKALGHALALRFPRETPILCIDRVHLAENSYLDIAAPRSGALPVVIKTRIFSR